MAKSTVQQIKDDQGYTKRAPKCANCEFFSFDKVGTKSKYSDQVFYEDKNLKCNLGGFATKKTTWCKLHGFKK